MAVGFAACAAEPERPTPDTRGSDPPRRTAAAAAEVTRLQSELMALADVALARISVDTTPGTLAKDPEVRQFSHSTRLGLGTSLIAIVTGPDPVDALLDILTHTTLVAEAMRNETKGMAADSVQARVLKALELNEADAWKLAERWLDAEARSALREHILSWPGDRSRAAGVAYVRLSDLPRTGATTSGAATGVVDSLRAAVQQTEQVRLLGERVVFLAQRLPFALRWQAEAFSYNTLAMSESQQVLDMPAQLSRERVAAIEDLFKHIETERKAAIEQLVEVVRQERSTALSEAAAVVAAQRKGVFDNLITVVADVEQRGTRWFRAGVVVLLLLIVVLLAALLGTLLLYRRLVRRMDRRPPTGEPAR